MATIKVVPRSLTEAYKRREGDFSPNLVGLQFTDGVSLFTFGNFQITTNLERKINKNFVLGGEWSEYYSLDNLNLTETQSINLLSNDIDVRLNFDINNISRYVYFGSFYEFVRVTLEQIIQKWKGALYLNPIITNTPSNTVLSFNYDSGNNVATFIIPESVVQNPYQLIIDDNTDFANLLPFDIFNLSRDYDKYVIWNANGSFPVIGYTGSTTGYQYLRVSTEGNPFPSLTASTFGQLTYHVKPNETEVELFFNSLTDFEKIILNRLTTPIYTSSFDVPSEADGFIVFSKKRFTWPITDGYNLDINSRPYGDFLDGILSMASIFDQSKTDLVARRFVAGSIHEFDTDGGGDEVYGRKVNKLLRIYGREFDQIKKYIDGISFANVVTYNKLDNTSDELIKILAKNLGFDVLLSVTTDNFNLIEQITPSYDTPFSGYSRSLSAKELDIELWRRLVINAWWLFKSKGTRKVIEFFLKLFNIPECVIDVNEYVYIAKDRLNINDVFVELQKILDTGDVTISEYPIDDYGFPRVLPETNENYFQMGGFWYNGGNESTVGNNPHFGEYDYGSKYFEQFECFVPNFQSLLTGSTLVPTKKNYFNNYNSGTFIFDQNGLPVPYYGPTYANIMNSGLVENGFVSSAGLVKTGGINSPKYNRPSGDTYSMRITFTAGTKQFCSPCPLELSFNPIDGIVYIKGTTTPLLDPKCCPTYWLPVPTTPPVPCPKPTELAITSPDSPLGPCVIIDINTNASVSQACCNKTTLGFDVTWDGKNCVDSKCSVPPCPDPTQLQLTSSNYVAGPCIYLDAVTGLPLSQDCCTSKGMYWDGKYCKDGICDGSIGSLGGGDLGTGTVGTSTFKTTTVDGNSLFGIGTTGPNVGVTPTNYCYWCPPSQYVKKYCSADEYVGSLTQSQINIMATTYGWLPPINGQIGLSPDSYLIIIFTNFFNTYGCLYVDNLNNPIKDEACCTLRGGTWTNTSNDDSVPIYSCVDPKVNPCGTGTIVNNNHVVVYNDGSLATQDCCSSLGYQWTNGTVNLYNNGSFINSFPDNTGLSYANAQGSNNYCTPCPININIVEECDDIIGICLLVIKNKSTSADLDKSCCEGYGYIYDANTNKCLLCPSVVTYEALHPYKILNLDNSDLSQTCCENVNGWYGDAYGDGSKCYQCPGIVVFDDLGNATMNPNYSVVGNEVLYNGSSLSQTCCDNYAVEAGAGSWDPVSGKCLIA